MPSTESGESFDYDVLLSHSSADKTVVEEIAHWLLQESVRPFLDEWHLIPGDPWQEALEEALDTSRTCNPRRAASAMGHDPEQPRSYLERPRPGDPWHRGKTLARTGNLGLREGSRSPYPRPPAGSLGTDLPQPWPSASPPRAPGGGRGIFAELGEPVPDLAQVSEDEAGEPGES